MSGNLRPNERSTQVPAAQYSPLAAQGGESRSRLSPWDAIVHYLNPHNLNMGQIWEQYRAAWLENAGANRYFWYSFWTTGVLIFSWFAIAWMHTDRVRERWELAEHAADALRYSEYCKRMASEAIGRYNAHIETCNRVIEAGESGLVTPEAATVEGYAKELARLKSDNDSKALQVQRLQDELDEKTKLLTGLSARIEAAEQKLRIGATPANTTNALTERITRVERENGTLMEENRRLRQQARKSRQPEDGNRGAGQAADADASRC